MNGIVINVDPVLVQLGSIEIRWYSIFIAIAVIAALIIATHEAKRKQISSDIVYSIAAWAIIGGILGARLFHVIDHFGYYTRNPSQIFGFEGLAIWGALAGGAVMVIAYSRIKRISLGTIADIIVPGLLVAQIIGRFGCIVNGDAYGGITDLPWGFIYNHPNASIPNNLMGLPTHPYPVYEILWNVAILSLIYKLRNRFRIDGLLFLTYLSLYSVGRFLLTFVRMENEFILGLQQAQIIAIGLILVSAVIAVYLSKRKNGSEAIRLTA